MDPDSPNVLGLNEFHSDSDEELEDITSILPPKSKSKEFDNSSELNGSEDLLNISTGSCSNIYQDISNGVLTDLSEIVQAELNEEIKRKEAEDIYNECNNMDMDSVANKDDIYSNFTIENERKVELLPKGISLFSRDKCLSTFKLDDIIWPLKNCGSTKNPELKMFSSLIPKEILDCIQEGRFEMTFCSKKMNYILPRYLLLRLCCTFNEEVSVIQDILNYLVDNSHVNLLPIILRNYPLCLKNLGAELSVILSSTNMEVLQGSPTKNRGDGIIPESFPFYNLTVLLQFFTKVITTSKNNPKHFKPTQQIIDMLDDFVVVLIGIGLDRLLMDIRCGDSITMCLAAVMEFYTENIFFNRVQGLVEKIIGWLLSIENSFEHHNASFLCSSIIPHTPLGYILSSSLAYYFLQCFLGIKDKWICDIVLVEDVWNLLDEATEHLNKESNCYVLQSYLTLIDIAIRPTNFDHKSKLHLQNISDRIQIMFKSKSDPESEIDQTRMKGLFKNLIDKWDKFTSYKSVDEVQDLRFT